MSNALFSSFTVVDMYKMFRLHGFGKDQDTKKCKACVRYNAMRTHASTLHGYFCLENLVMDRLNLIVASLWAENYNVTLILPDKK